MFAEKTPPMYSLIDLAGDSVEGRFYAHDLTKTVPNFDTDYFFVEKILRTKFVKKEKFVLVKYLFMPNKLNAWIPYKDLKIGPGTNIIKPFWSYVYTQVLLNLGNL